MPPRLVVGERIYYRDLTSTYFEGQRARNDKAKRGHSRDHRADCKQVVVGLVVNREGFPVTHEVFAGNTQDRKTLATTLDRLAERASLRQGATVVVDRGMAFDDNLAEITERKLHYVIASRQPERDRCWSFKMDGASRSVVVQSHRVTDLRPRHARASCSTDRKNRVLRARDLNLNAGPSVLGRVRTQFASFLDTHAGPRERLDSD